MGRLLVGLLTIAVLFVLWPYYSNSIPFLPPPTARPPAPYSAGPPTPGPTPEASRTDSGHPANRFIAVMTSFDTTFHVEGRIGVVNHAAGRCSARSS
jgi:hypothetical protein